MPAHADPPQLKTLSRDVRLHRDTPRCPRSAPCHDFSTLFRCAARERIVGWYSTGPKIRSSDCEFSTTNTQKRGQEAIKRIASHLCLLIPCLVQASVFQGCARLLCLVFQCPELSRLFVFAVEINEVFKKYTRHPVLAIIDVQPQDDMGIPTDAYVAVEEVKDVRSHTASLGAWHKCFCFLCF